MTIVYIFLIIFLIGLPLVLLYRTLEISFDRRKLKTQMDHQEVLLDKASQSYLIGDEDIGDMYKELAKKYSENPKDQF